VRGVVRLTLGPANRSNWFDVPSAYMRTPPVTTGDLPPEFLQLAAHPVRWRLLNALAESDLRVRDLCERLALPQSLVSYHLGRLRSATVVDGRRSSADGRDVYYVLDLGRCAEMLAESGGSLHPGLALRPPTRSSTDPGAWEPRIRVLFLCTGNSARSQIAQALVENVAGGSVEACSAGSRPKPLHPNAIRVLHERGIDIAGRSSKHLDTFTDQRFDYVISLCDRVREVCPEFPGHPDVVHWSVPDPARSGDNDAETYPAFQRTVTELIGRIGFLLKRIDHQRPASR
jgi:ArsR family transcriptional regulator, arsenate/arsenite/antimonite-responsive transcriptional repressor / arsenate reductase (thioredoxin)